MSLRDILIWIRAQLVKEKNDSQGGGGGVLGLSIYGTFWDLSHIWLSIKQIENMLDICAFWRKKTQLSGRGEEEESWVFVAPFRIKITT